MSAQSALLQEIAGPAGQDLNAQALRADARRESLRLLALLAPSLFLVCAIIIVPIGWLFWLSLFDETGAFSAANYARFFEQASYIKTFISTFKVAFIVTGACVLLGYPLAYMLSQLPRRAASICLIFVILPFWTSVLVRTYAWLVILQRKGLINSWLIDLGVISQPLSLANNFSGVVIGMTHILLPFLVLPLYASMKTIDTDCLRAGMNLGAGPAATFRQIFFPLSLPGLASGVVIVFVLCLGFFVTPALMGGGKVVMWAMRMEQTTSLYSNWGAGAALGVVLLVVTLALLGLFQWLLGARATGVWSSR
ncbi:MULTISPECIES: ABC transporter permease [unclassified Mesorhizobium]|uniref:ABC transporter permease n=1 Tax=unclassified Mesorhizobium TaxID=325217 RepID=UPI000FD82376|nr:MULTISPECIES: ABC transporter permease [unclassified Mesorhizobium]TGR42724.1 ABC transporter permease [bacterium M00.F.Ca.ET.199.01.1.1]TGU30106.1 ABC transporter permease [bacterium M00.F.Ca.ET.156.01.1.1]TGV84834.1 ABC transporter permease [Mesorhizobium sp. M00.F.Ca.ET.149.01.1.1]RWC84030.1 MAG: ABC transporter permease [Mesorhizobium sp.]TGR24195.1 ABC transporter permease [Mesorhizobium sp. M8A.F.Ca.ET.202.01.1.1]